MNINLKNRAVNDKVTDLGVLVDRAKGNWFNDRNIIKSPSIHLFHTVRQSVISGKWELLFKDTLSKEQICVLFLIDSSGSMLQKKQISFIKGLIEKTVQTKKRSGISYGAVSIVNNSAQITSPITHRAESILTGIKELKTGGKTNMTAGLKLIKAMSTMKHKSQWCELFIFTDGRINEGDTPNPFLEAVSYYKENLRSLKKTTVVSAEEGFVKLQMAKKFAVSIGAKLIEI